MRKMNIYVYNWILHGPTSDSGCSKKLTSGWTKTNRWITKQGKSWTMLTRFSELADIIKVYYHDNNHHCLKALPYKVKRCLARYSPRTTTTNQPTNRAQNKPSGPVCAQESIFWGKNGRCRAIHPNHFGREQKFWYPHFKKPPRHHVCIVFLVGDGTKWIRKTNIWPIMPNLVPSYQRHLFRVQNIDRQKKVCNFDPKIWIIYRAKSQFFVLKLRFL